MNTVFCCDLYIVIALGCISLNARCKVTTLCTWQLNTINRG